MNQDDIVVLDPSSVANLRTDVVAQKLAPPPPQASKIKKESSKPNTKVADKFAQNAGKELAQKQQKELEAYEKELEDRLKQLQLDKICNYREKFTKLKKRNNVSGKSSLDDLNDEVHYIEMQLGSADPGGDNPASLLLVAGMTGAEWVTSNKHNPLNLNLTGLGQTTRENISMFEPLLDEIMIKYGQKLVVSVEMRLALLIGTTVMTVHAANSGMSWPSKIAVASQKAEAAANPDKYKGI